MTRQRDVGGGEYIYLAVGARFLSDWLTYAQKINNNLPRGIMESPAEAC